MFLTISIRIGRGGLAFLSLGTAVAGGFLILALA